MRTLAYFLLGVFLGLWLRELMKSPPSSDEGDGLPDLLTEIQGIGPVFEQALHDIGIQTFVALARQTPDSLAERLAGRVPAERIRRERWIEQAQERARFQA